MKTIIKKILLGYCLLVSLASRGQSLYNMETISTIEITFQESNWDALLDAEYAADGDYILAQEVTVNGVTMDSVGVKYKGNSTYQANQVKNPWHIELDTYKDHSYDGYTDIKLSNVAKDPSFLREVLSYQILRQYMDAPLSNYANVYVNGTLIGLYSNYESISKKFVNSRFYSKSNTFIKCNPPEGAGPQSDDFPNLVYLGQDSTLYEDAYELKSDYGWNELIDLCDTLANNLTNIQQILDVDRALWMLAFNNVVVNLDSYSGQFAQNYYLYRDDYGRFLPVLWDLNESFGRFSMSGAGNLNNTSAKQRMDHLLHDNDADFPLISQLLSVPKYKRMYLAHMKTMLLENFDNDSYRETALALSAIIDEAVQADQNKFFTYADFQSNFNNDIISGGGPGGASTPGITNLMDGRNDYLLDLSDLTAVEPTIDHINVSSSTPVVNQTIFISAAIAEADVAYLAYRSDLGAPFIEVEMKDDGANNDDSPGDGIYGAALPIENITVEYYIYAENQNIGKFSPVRAQHEFYSLTATNVSMAGDLVINEFMASNDVTVSDQDGEFDDWIEFYNNGTETITLDGYSLSDDPDNLTKWSFPEGVKIEPQSYLIVWADNDTEQEGLHASFKLSASEESIHLSDTDGTILDEVIYIDQDSDVSFGRYPNGTGNFMKLEATFNSENVLLSSVTDPSVDVLGMRVYPNPAKDAFIVDFNQPLLKTHPLAIFNAVGQVYYNGFISVGDEIDVSSWPSGIYILRSGQMIEKIIVD